MLFVETKFLFEVLYASAAMGVVGCLYYFLQYKKPVVEELVINMVDVGEETGELDVMLYKVADYYDEEVRTLTDGMMKLIEPVMIIVLGLVVLFIVVALFMPLIGLISGLQFLTPEAGLPGHLSTIPTIHTNTHIETFPGDFSMSAPHRPSSFRTPAVSRWSNCWWSSPSSPCWRP